MRYLLDTNIVSDMIRRPDGPVAKQFARIGQHDIGVSIIVAAELRYGALRRGTVRLVRSIEELLDRLSIMPFEDPADRYYGEIRAQLEQTGTPIGRNDTLIAAHALALSCTLVTDNEREFSRVKSLKVENWLR
jgi:tRNA(fMet)-specific endonuclease VapC